jgi:hypothetical protein
MNTPTLVKCECCHEDTASDKTTWDDDLRENVCQDCAGNLANAADAMKQEWEKSGHAGKIPPVHRGPFHGSSVG